MKKPFSNYQSFITKIVKQRSIKTIINGQCIYARMKKNENCFILHYSSNYSSKSPFNTIGFNYCGSSFVSRNSLNPISSSPSTSHTYDEIIKLRDFVSSSLENQKQSFFYRYITPFSSTFFSELGTNALEVAIDENEKKVSLYLEKIDNHNFLTIDFKFKCTEEDLYDYSFKLLVSLGLVSNYLALSEAYIFAYNTIEMEDAEGVLFRSMPPSIHIDRPVFCNNVYSLYIPFFQRLNGAQGEKMAVDFISKNSFKKSFLTREQFQSIVSTILHDKNALRGAELLLYAESQPLDYRPCILSVAMESLCDMKFYKSDTKYLDETHWSPIKDEIVSILNSADVQDEVRDNMIKSINKINSLSNHEKLEFPFKKIEYTLSSDEANVLNKRNIFLHGHLGVNNDPIDTLFKESLLLERLCVILILRAGGFTGEIVDWVSFYFSTNSSPDCYLSI